MIKFTVLFQELCEKKQICDQTLTEDLLKKWNKLVTELQKWFPLQGERAQSLKVFNVRMLVFKNTIEMRKKRGNKVIIFSTYYMYTTSPKTLYQGHI